jgi:hypothetical protein
MARKKGLVSMAYTPGKIEKPLVTKEDLLPIEEDEVKVNLKSLATDLPDGYEVREDRNRELRSMLLSVYCCPPLPQLALGGLNKEDRVFSSHDFLATCIDRMLVQKNVDFDRERRANQYTLTKKLFSDLEIQCGDVNVKPNPETVYETFSIFSREYASLYFKPEHRSSLDIRFKPLDHVCRQDPVHLATCSHLRAYRIMRDIQPKHEKQFKKLNYKNLLLAFARELVRVDEADL